MAVIAGQGVAGITMVNEDDPLDHLHELGVGYVESKWVSEYLVRKAGQAGLPVAIYRAADISGHSVTGTWNTKTEMCCMKKFILDIGAFPNAELPMDYTPVDVFADVLIHIVLNEKLTGRTYHVTNPNKAHISLLADRLRARGHQIKQVSWEDWVSQMVNLAVQSPEHPMTPFAPLFIDRCPSGRMSVAQMYLEDTFPRFSRDNVDLALNGTGIVFPEVNAELVDRYLDFLQSRAFI
jgi:thioester reductase-like protein